MNLLNSDKGQVKSGPPRGWRREGTCLGEDILAGFLGEVAGRPEGVGVPFTPCRATEAGVSTREAGPFSGLEGCRAHGRPGRNEVQGAGDASIARPGPPARLTAQRALRGWGFQWGRSGVRNASQAA